MYVILQRESSDIGVEMVLYNGFTDRLCLAELQVFPDENTLEGEIHKLFSERWGSHCLVWIRSVCDRSLIEVYRFSDRRADTLGLETCE